MGLFFSLIFKHIAIRTREIKQVDNQNKSEVREYLQIDLMKFTSTAPRAR